MRRLHFGGTFNPIHVGHLVAARAVAEAAGFDRVSLVPSRISPHKQRTSPAPMADRLALCRLAVEGDPLFEVDPIESERPGPSYTIDTADELRRRGATEVFWLIGADMAGTLPSWHQADRLLQQVNFVFIGRPGWTLEPASLSPSVRALAAAAVTAPLIEISSTLIRERVAAGLSIRHLTPPAVVDYIASHRLYTSGATA